MSVTQRKLLDCKCNHPKDMHDHLGFCRAKNKEKTLECVCLNSEFANASGKLFWIQFSEEDVIFVDSIRKQSRQDNFKP